LNKSARTVSQGKMKIISDDELKKVAARVSNDLAAIQGYLGQKSSKEGKIRFPRNFIRTATYFRGRFWFIEDEELKANISYTLIQSDVYRWILNRTDIFGTAKEMIIKQGICLFAFISESLSKDYLKAEVGKKRPYKGRTKYLREKEIITSQIEAELNWLWDRRESEHIFLANEREHQSFKLPEYNRALKAIRGLVNSLDLHSKSKLANR
tara:strand:- start:422 stop:1051 length:630 start_codon:yes stop_codon:yes gene_type:complete